jgi:hypothetical protein
MSSQSGKPAGQKTVLISLVAALTCAYASDAAASRSSVAPAVDGADLSARVTALVERVRALRPALVRDLPAASKTAQFKNH